MQGLYGAAATWKVLGCHADHAPARVLGSAAYGLTCFCTRCADVQSSGVLQSCARGLVTTINGLQLPSITRLRATQGYVCMLLCLSGLHPTPMLRSVEFLEVGA